MGVQVLSALPMSYPAALHFTTRPASTPGAGTVVFVHGSLDRGESFRRVMRRLPEFATVAYDRRGYQGSRGGGVVELGGHIDDLLAVAGAARAESGGGPVVAVGHSFGGDVVLGAALASPGAFDSIGAFEPPMPWLGFRRQRRASHGPRPPTTPAWRRSGSSAAWWARRPGPTCTRTAGPRAGPTGRPWWPTYAASGSRARPSTSWRSSVPAVFGRGGPTSAPHHRQTVEWLGDNVPGAVLFEIANAQHGAHLSHPDAFAAMTRLVLERAGGPDGLIRRTRRGAARRRRRGPAPRGAGASGGATASRRTRHPCPRS